jgi:hypothetical protein
MARFIAAKWAHLLPSCCTVVAAVNNGSNRKALTAPFGYGEAMERATKTVPSGKRPEPRDCIELLAQKYTANACAERKRAAAEDDNTSVPPRARPPRIFVNFFFLKFCIIRMRSRQTTFAQSNRREAC